MRWVASNYGIIDLPFSFYYAIDALSSFSLSLGLIYVTRGMGYLPLL
jgi:hypothetical protein